MNQIIIFIVGIVLGGVAVWITRNKQILDSEGKARAAESRAEELRLQIRQKEEQINQIQLELAKQQEARAIAETRLQEARAALEEEKRMLADATTRLTDTFNALSAEALKSNNQVFLDLARKTLENLITEAKGSLGRHQEAIGGVIKPLQEALQRYETQIQEMEKERARSYGSLIQHLNELRSAQEKLQKEAASLSTALRTPQVRGSWGEITLRRVVEIADMSPHCDFEEQFSLDTGEGRLRPDLIIRLPGERIVAVDAKAPIEPYRRALETDDEEKRKVAFAQYAKAVREHMKRLSSKEYWKYLSPSPEFVVLFLPGESFFSAALEEDRNLIEDGVKAKVILATPTTLITLLKTIAYTWQQQEITENARRIGEAAQELFERILKFTEYLNEIGKGLENATKSYNAAVRSFESRLLPGARQLKELGAAPANREVPEVKPVDIPAEEILNNDNKKEDKNSEKK